MKAIKKMPLNRLCLIGGGLLIAAALILVVYAHFSTNRYAAQCAEYVSIVQKMLPTPQSAVPEGRLDNTMPVMAVDGEDIAALLEFPSHDATLPVADRWGDPNTCPRRFDGSVYDDSLIIGGTDRRGQMDFVKEIAVGDTLYVTDMTGNRYAYTVTDIEIARHADKETLQKSDTALTVFIKNSTAFEYFILRCGTKTF